MFTRLMLEVTHSCAEHCDSALICLLYRILITHTTSWLYDSLHAILSGQSYGVVKWEESV